MGHASWGKGRPCVPNFYSFRPQQIRNKDSHSTALWVTIHVFEYFPVASFVWECWAVDGKSPQIQECPLAALVILFFHYWFLFELRHCCHSPVPKLVVANWFSSLLHNWRTGLIGTIRTTCYKLLISFVTGPGLGLLTLCGIERGKNIPLLLNNRILFPWCYQFFSDRAWMQSFSFKITMDNYLNAYISKSWINHSWNFGY